MKIEATGTEEELEAFIALLEEVGGWLWHRKIHQWEPGTQRAQRARLAAWVRAGALLLARGPDGLAGGCIVSRSAVDGWKESSEPAAYLYKLAVARSHAGCGLGDTLLVAAADWARERHIPRLRLDCWDGNPVLRSFYRERGFEELHAVTTHGFEVRLFEQRL